MMTKKFILLSILFLILSIGLHAQSTPYEDSLTNELSKDLPSNVKKEILFQLGEYLVQRNPEKAETYANQLTDMSTEPIDSADWARTSYIYAASHRWQGNYTTALGYYQETYDYYKRKGVKDQVARSASKIGSINTFLGNNAVAQRFLLESAEIYQRVGSSRQKASINSALAGLYLNIDQLDKGKERYLQALEAFTSIDDSAGMASVNANLGYLYAELGEYDKSESHLLAQKKLNKVFPTMREMGFHHDFMGVLRQKQGRLRDAYKEHLIALNIRKELSSTYNLCESKLNVGQILIKMGKYQEAIDQLDDVMTYQEHNSLNQQVAAQELLSLAHEKMGNYSVSLDKYKNFKAIEDSINSKTAIETIAEKDAQYKKKEQDAEIRILNQQQEISEQRAQRARLIIIGSLIALIIFSLLSFFIYRLYRQVKGQNVLISQSLSEKEDLLREIHHRVKNNLQVVSSLLSLQSRYIEDSAAQEAVNEGQNRVKSMALIHQKLYQKNNLAGVEALDYIENLSRNIQSTYGVDTDRIKMSYDVGHLMIDVDTIIPLGLILNELISNAFKHAFPDGQDGELHISLQETDKKLELLVKDNGVGSNMSIQKSGSFGMQMIKSLSRKLETEPNFDFSNGTAASFAISRYKLV